MKGTLQEMSVADLVQHSCQNEKTASLQIENDQRQAEIFFDSGEVVHAQLGDLQGEQAIYHALALTDGKFALHANVESSVRTIDRSWPSLLLEGARHLDEGLLSAPAPAREKVEAEAPEKSPELLLMELSSWLDGALGAAIVRADGREIASYAKEPSADIANLVAPLVPFARDLKSALDRDELLRPRGHVFSTKNRTALLRFLGNASTFVALFVEHGRAGKAQTEKELHTISESYGQLVARSVGAGTAAAAGNLMLVFVDAQGKTIFANRQFLYATQHADLGKITGRPLSKLLRMDADVVRRLLRDIAQMGVVQKRVLALGDGGEYVSCTGIATLDENGKFLQADLSLQPVLTERKQTSSDVSIPDESRLPEYLAAQLDGLQSYLEQLGGRTMANKLARIVNETAERAGWAVRFGEEGLDIRAEGAEYEACAALLAKSVLYCAKVVGKDTAVKVLEAEDQAFGEDAERLADSLGVHSLIASL